MIRVLWSTNRNCESDGVAIKEWEFELSRLSSGPCRMRVDGTRCSFQSACGSCARWCGRRGGGTDWNGCPPSNSPPFHPSSQAKPSNHSYSATAIPIFGARGRSQRLGTSVDRWVDPGRRRDTIPDQVTQNTVVPSAQACQKHLVHLWSQSRHTLLGPHP